MCNKTRASLYCHSALMPLYPLEARLLAPHFGPCLEFGFAVVGGCGAPLALRDLRGGLSPRDGGCVPCCPLGDSA